MKAITILVCKLLVFAGKLLGKGSSLPGKIALKLCPNILSRLTLPRNIIAITGSNGKTSTVEMLAKVLQENGKQVVWNKEGSNQIEGVTTLLLKSATLGGTVKGDVVLLESDERFARLTFRHIKPTMFVITNLYRDQLTRNGHPYRVYDAVKDAVELLPDARLVLNADDPIVRNFGYGRDNVVYFGMDKNGCSTAISDALFNDCHYCPRCKAPMEYDYFHYTHLGSYRCTGCDFSRPATEFTVEAMDFEKDTITINGDCISLELASKYNVYNLCAAYTAACLTGVEGASAAKTLSDFVMHNGRVVRFRAGENTGVLITSKHENSTSYNQSLSYVSTRNNPVTLVVLVDAISRKYYTAETSWLWDISFEMLQNSSVKKIVLTGKYAYDLGLRFQAANITSAEILVEPDMDRAVAAVSGKDGNALYAVTCFSDKGKLFSRVQILGDGVK